MTSGADGDHHAGAFLPERERQRARIRARAVIDVDEVDAGRLDVDQRLAGAERRLGDVLETENLGPACLVKANRLHLILAPWEVST